MVQQPKIRLGVKLQLPFVTMITVAVIVLTFIVSNSYQLQRQSAQDRQRQVSAQASFQVYSYVNLFHDQLADAARGLIYAGADPARQRDLLERVQLAHRQFYDLSVTDAAGQETARKIFLVPEYQVALKSRAGSEAFQAASSGRFYLGSVYISEEHGAPFVQMAVPVYDAQGVVTGTLVAEVDLTRLWSIVKDLQAGQNGYVYVVDGRGWLIAYRESEMVQGPMAKLPDVSGVPQVRHFLDHRQESSAMQEQASGLPCRLHPDQAKSCVPVMAYHRPIEGTDWGIIVEQPVADAYAQANQLLSLAVVLAIVALLVLVLLAWYVQRGVLRPIHLLSEGATALAGGQLARRIAIRTGDEIEGLANRFNAMAESLQRSQAQLEAFALEKSQQAEAAQARVREMTALLESGRAITSLDLENVLDSLAAEAARAVKADQCLIYLKDERSRTLTARGIWGLGEIEYAATSLEWGESAAGWAASEGRDLFLANAQLDRRFVCKTPTDRLLTSVLALPLISDGQVIGVLQVATRAGKVSLSANEKRLIESFARQAAVAYKNAQLYEEERHRAREMTIVAEITRTISTSLDLDTTLNLILQSVRELVPYDESEVNLWQPHDRTLVTRGRVGGQAASEPGNVYGLEEGLTGWIARNRQPVLVADIQVETPVRPKVDLTRFPFRSFVGVPLLLGSELVGTLELASFAPHAFNTRHLDTLQTVANQAAVAIQNARLFEETHRRAEEMAALRESAVEIAGQLEPERILRAIVERAVALLRAKGGALYQVNAEQQTLTVIVSFSLERDYTGATIRIGEGLAGRVAQKRQPMIVNDYRHWEGRASRYADDPFTAVIGVPLIWQDELMGVLDVLADEAQRRFDDEDLRLIMLFASQAAVALQNARLYEQVMRRIEEMSALHETAVDIASRLDPDQLLETIVRRAVELLHAGGGSLYQSDPVEPVARLIVGYNLGRDYRGVVIKPGEDLAGQVLQSKQPLIVNDYANWSGRSPQLAAASFTAAMGAPLIWQDRMLGVLTVVDTAERRAFNLNDLRLLTLFASQAVVALENARLFAESQRRVAELATLTEIGQALSSTLRVDELLQLVYEQTRRVMYAENMFIALYDPTRDEVEFALSRNLAEVPPGARRPANIGLVGYIIKNRKSILLRADAVETIRRMGVELVGLPSTSWLGVPMLSGERVLGVIAVQHYTEPNVYDESHRALLEAIASQAAIALDNARLYQLTDVRLQQRVEELTGLITISQELNTTFYLDRIFELVLGEAVRATRAQYGMIHMVDASADELTVRAVHGFLADEAGRTTGTSLRMGEGVIGRVIATGQPAMVSDVSQDPNYLPGLLDTRSELCVPIRYAESIVGAINLESTELAHFTRDHLDYLQALAAQAAIAIGNVQRQEEQMQRGELLRRRAEQLSTLFEISQAFRSDRPLEETLDDVAHAIQETVGFNVVIVSVVEGDPPMKRRVAAAGIPVQDFERLKAVLQPWSVMGDLLRDEFRISQSYYIPAEKREARAALDVYDVPGAGDQPRQPGRWHPQDMLFVPLHGAQQRLLGVISVDAPRDGAVPTRPIIETLEVFANQAAVAIENTWLYADLRRRIAELSLLYETGEAVSGTLSLDETLDVALKGLTDGLKFDFAMISLVDETAGEVRAVRGVGVSERQVQQARRRLDSRDIMADIVRTGKTEVIEGWDERFDRDMFEREGHAALVRVFTPLVAHNRNIGLVEAGYRRERRERIAEHEVQLLHALADRIAAAIENARLYEETVKRTHELSSLLDASAALSASLQLTDVLTALADHLTEVINVGNCTLSRWDKDKDCVVTLVDRLKQAAGPSAVGTEYSLQDYPLTRRVLETRQPVTVYVDDPAADPTEVALLKEQGAEGLLMLPLVVRDQVFGLIELTSLTPGARFTEADTRLVQTLADQAGVAISNAELYEEIRGFTQELEQRVADRTEDLRHALDQLTLERDRVETLFRITSELQASLDLDRVLNRALTLVNENIRAARAWILLVDAQSDALICRAALDPDQTIPPGGRVTRFRRSEGLIGWSIRRRKSALVPDVQRDPYWMEGEGGPGASVRSLLVVPLLVADDVLGLLLLSHPDLSHFTEAHLRLLEAAAAQIATAINNAELYRMIRESAERLGQMLRTQQEEASKSQAILEAVADGVMVADRHGRVILFNAAAERILGSSRAEITGRLTDDLLGLYGAGGAAWAGVVRQWATSAKSRMQTPSLEQRLQIEDRHVRMHISPVMMGDEYLGTVAVFRDVTKEVEVDRAKSDFVSTVSHELRTPMTSIKGYADLLLLGAAGGMSDDQRHFLSIIKSNADRLSDLVNDLLNISRIESGRVELDIKPLRLDALIEQVVASLRGRIEEKGLQISIQVPADLPAVQADHDRLIQILTNLVSNACQYTRPGGQIVVRARAGDGTVQTDVADTGVGIAPEDQPKVFDRFFRSDHEYVQEFAGTGLGLAIVKQLIQMHHGEIWLESQLDKGTTFSFTLPAVTPPA